MTRAYLFIALFLAVALAAVLVMQARAGAPEIKLPALGGWQWPEEHVECVSYVVGEGDTLWAIAGRYYPERDPWEVVWAIRQANGLEGAEGPLIRPGDRLWIPDPGKYGVGRR